MSQSQVKDFIGEHSAPYVFNQNYPSRNFTFALALASPGEAPIENLRAQIIRSQPKARIFEVTAPPGKDPSKQYREFLSEVLYRLGEAPLRHGQASAVAARLPKILSQRFNYCIIDHAEHMGQYSIDALRRDRGCPPVILVAYDDRILHTLLANESLLHQVFMLS
jgi:hypothetical protein